MLRLNLLLVNLIVLQGSFLVGQSAVSPIPQGGPAEPNSASLVLELDRAVLVLRRGTREKWETRDQYLTAFEKTPDTDSMAHSVAKTKKYVECAIGVRLRIHHVWDEGPPIGVEVHRAIIELTEWRRKAAAGLPLPTCPVPLAQRVSVAPGVAMGMLKTKFEPIYPRDIRISGTVVLHAIISSRGRVESLNVVSGPIMLRQSALDAVRQWTFRPYLLNDRPVEVETTINVVMSPSH